jgi:hypothetical protein
LHVAARGRCETNLKNLLRRFLGLPYVSARNDGGSDRLRPAIRARL